MDLLIVKVKGKFAHFRKFYTNSSSLSYSVPPRTVLSGMLGAILGYERDSYYDIFSKEKLNIAVKKDKNIRKIMQTLNYIKATSPKNILQPSEHTQIPFEILTGDNDVEYTVYINHTDKSILDELELRIKSHRYVFAPYLGAAPFNCTFEFVKRIEGIPESSESNIRISTLIDTESIVEGSIDIKEDNIRLLKERMPREFLKERVIGKTASYIYDDNGHPLSLRINGTFVNADGENIIFM